MSARRTLLEMKRDLRVELGMDPDVNLHTHVNDTHVGMLQRVQRLLYDNETWPSLRAKFSVDVSALATSLALPAGLDPGAISEVYVLDMDATSSRPYLIKHGWDENEKVSADPETPTWPVYRWQLEAPADAVTTDFDRTVTFWPYPDRDCRFIFYGRRALGTFTDDAHYSTLDSDLIVLQAAAEIAAQKEMPDAPLKASAANRRKENILARERGDVSDIDTMIRW